MKRLNSFLALGTAFIALTISSGVIASDTQDELAFHPAKTWEVGSIKPVSDYSGECIIQTEFNNGFLLQINGSSNWVQQLNLNIRQNAFEIDKSYDVTLNIPGRASETIAGTAYRGNIISVPLKGKKELYKSMREHGVLDLGIEGNDFRFYMTGFNAAAHTFERCMAGGAPGLVAAKNVRDPDAELPLEADTSEGLGGIVVTSDDLSESEKEFLLNESLAFEEQEVEAKDVPVETIEAEETDKQSLSEIDEEDAVAALNESAAKVAMERAGLDVSNDQSLPETLAEEIETSAGNPDGDFDDTESVAFEPPPSELEALVESDPIPEESIDIDVVEASPVEDNRFPVMPQSDRDVAESLLAQPEKTLKTSKTITTPEVQVVKEFASAEADFSSTTIETADSKALARIVALEKELEAARAENEALNDELQTSLKEGKMEQISVETDNWNLERATMRYNEAERQMKKLGQQLQKERAQHAMEKKELEAMLFDPAVTEQEQLARLSQLERELAEARAELEKARSGL